MNQIKIGKFIKERREEKKLTQVELAEKLGVSNRTISKWENGNHLPDYSMLEDICDTLDVSINELLSGEKLTKENYQKHLEKNIVDTINYNNKKRNKRLIKLGITLCAFIVVFFLYKAFVIYLYDEHTKDLNTEENSFPVNKNISTLNLVRNNKANKEFNSYVDLIKVYIPEEFELVTDKAKTYLVQDSCDVYIKGYRAKDSFDAAILLCDEHTNGISYLEPLGIKNTIFPYLNVDYTLYKNDIYTVKDMLKYYEKHYKDKFNIFSSFNDINMHYIASNFVAMTLPSYDSFYYLENNLEGYLLKYNYGKQIYDTFFYTYDGGYSIELINMDSEYFNDENVKEILESIKK